MSEGSQTRLQFKSTTHPMHEEVTAAEVRNTAMLAHHNAALCLADYIGAVQCKNFPDSQNCQELSLCRNKNSTHFKLCPSSIHR